MEQSQLQADSAFFRGLMSLWIHEDRLIWSHTRTLIALQAGVLGGAYSIHGPSKVLAILLLVLGVILSVILFLIIQNNKQFRDRNAPLTVKIGKSLSQPYCDADTLEFGLSAKLKWFRRLTGLRLLMCVVILLVVVDIGMIIWVWV